MARHVTELLMDDLDELCGSEGNLPVDKFLLICCGHGDHDPKRCNIEVGYSHS